jgi:hypothetical protein
VGTLISVKAWRGTVPRCFHPRWYTAPPHSG